MVTEVEMTVWIQSVWSCEKVKDQIVRKFNRTLAGVVPNKAAKCVLLSVYFV